jgi:putative sterol carrier protein
MADKFMSKEWAEKAMAAINANPAVKAGLRDAPNFTNKMMFDCGEGQDAVHCEFEAGTLTYMGPPTFADDDLWLIIRADKDTWKTAASGEVEGGKLLMAGKIKFAKGPITAAVQNAAAFNNFLTTWGQVDTDWS